MARRPGTFAPVGPSGCHGGAGVSRLSRSSSSSIGTPPGVGRTWRCRGGTHRRAFPSPFDSALGHSNGRQAGLAVPWLHRVPPRLHHGPPAVGNLARAQGRFRGIHPGPSRAVRHSRSPTPPLARRRLRAHPGKALRHHGIHRAAPCEGKPLTRGRVRAWSILRIHRPGMGQVASPASMPISSSNRWIRTDRARRARMVRPCSQAACRQGWTKKGA